MHFIFSDAEGWDRNPLGWLCCLSEEILDTHSSVLFVAASHSRRFQCDLLNDCNLDWSKLLWAPSQHFPLSGKHCDAFCSPLERALLVWRPHGLLFWLWRVPPILSTAQGFPWRSLRGFHTLFSSPQEKLITQQFREAVGKTNLQIVVVVVAKCVQFRIDFNFA